MKKLLVFLFSIFVCTIAIAHTINWHVGDQIISTTTCSAGDSITPPTAPTKYGYHFTGWKAFSFLEYFVSTGTQYIDLNLTAKENQEIYIKYTFISVGFVFGSRANQNSEYSGVTYEENGGLFVIRWGNTRLYATGQRPTGIVEILIKNGATFVNGDLVATTNYGSSFFYGNLYLFTLNNNTEPAATGYSRHQIYSFHINIF